MRDDKFAGSLNRWRTPMALILSLREGESFYVDDHRIVLHKIKSPESFVIQTPDGKYHKIVEAEATEALPDVMISAGYRHEFGQARIAIEAPRSMIILREHMYGGPGDGV
jgi:sRNA-binding carbon storage regulator CsrA